MQITTNGLKTERSTEEHDLGLPDEDDAVELALAPDDEAIEEAPEQPASPSTAPVPWIDPKLGGLAVIGRSSEYVSALLDLHQALAGRDDAIARCGSAAIMEEVQNHILLNSHLNSLIT